MVVIVCKTITGDSVEGNWSISSSFQLLIIVGIGGSFYCGNISKPFVNKVLCQRKDEKYKRVFVDDVRNINYLSSTVFKFIVELELFRLSDTQRSAEDHSAIKTTFNDHCIHP